MNEGYRFFLIILISAVSLGLIYYFTNKDRKLALGVDVSVEGGHRRPKMHQENFTQDSPYEQRMPYVPEKENDDPALQQLRDTSCYPKNTLAPEELLPKSDATLWSESNPSAGALKDRNFLQSGNMIGINTVGSTLRNANLQLRSEPPNPQVQVSPWMQTTILPDLGRKPLEVGGCA